MTAELVDDAIGEGIGEGDAEFDEVGAGGDEGGDELGGGVEIGIACDEVGDEGFAFLLAESDKELVDAVGGGHGSWGDSDRLGRSITRENRFRLR